MDFFLMCVFLNQREEHISLEVLSRELMKEGIDITKQSLQERFNDEAVAFMKKMLGRIMAVKLEKVLKEEVIKEFKRIIIGDSTVFQLPEKFHYKYRGSGGVRLSKNLPLLTNLHKLLTIR